MAQKDIEILDRMPFLTKDAVPKVKPQSLAYGNK